MCKQNKERKIKRQEKLKRFVHMRKKKVKRDFLYENERLGIKAFSPSSKEKKNLQKNSTF
jgi:glutaredoxin-related protein